MVPGIMAGLLTAASAQSGQSALDKARHALETGHISEAEAELKTVLKNDPNSVPANLLLAAERGRTEYDAGDKQAARRDFEDYVKVTPDRPEGNLFLGILDYDARQYRSAIGHLNKAVALDPAQAEAFYYLGQSLYCLGESAEAENAVRKSLVAAFRQGRQRIAGASVEGTSASPLIRLLTLRGDDAFSPSLLNQADEARVEQIATPNEQWPADFLG